MEKQPLTYNQVVKLDRDSPVSGDCLIQGKPWFRQQNVFCGRANAVNCYSESVATATCDVNVLEKRELGEMSCVLFTV